MFKLNFLIQKLLSPIALLTLTACSTPEVCRELGTCGGELVPASTDGTLRSKTWNVTGSCLNDEAAAPTVPSLIHQAPTPAGEMPPRRTQVNFCSEMILTPQKAIKIVQPWFPSLPIQSGLITYTSAGTFSASINYFGSAQELDFAAGCFLSQGFKIVPKGQLTTSDTMTCKEFQPILLQGLETQPNITNFNCEDDGGGGCTCTYDLLLITAVEGKYAAIGNVINHYDSVSNNPVSSADYCVENNELRLSGYKRQFLFNQPALRSLVLAGKAAE